jgi:ribosomal protein S18 acetylase RimI-like enzyme
MMPQQSLTANHMASLNRSISVTKADPSMPASFWREIAVLHQREIQRGFISSLNPKFLESIYKSIARSNDAFLLVATESGTGRLLGFICGSTNTKATLVHVMVQSGARLVFALLPNAISFRTIRKMFETVRYAKGNGNPGTLPRAEILNFCVDRRVQGKGIGGMLFAALRNEYRLRAVKQIKIVTGESQVSAQRFYEAVNARRTGDLQIHDNSRSVVFVYDIT